MLKGGNGEGRTSGGEREGGRSPRERACRCCLKREGEGGGEGERGGAGTKRKSCVREKEVVGGEQRQERPGEGEERGARTGPLKEQVPGTAAHLI